MKTIISKVLIILLMLNLIAPFSAFAAEDKVIYNCGEKIRLTNGLQLALSIIKNNKEES